MMLADHAVASTEQASVIIVLAIVSAVTTIVSGLFAYLAKVHSKSAATSSAETSDAVNHRHKYGVDENGEPTTPKLFDLALETHKRVETLDAWRNEWQGLPSEISDADGLNSRLSELDAAVAANNKLLVDLDTANTEQHSAIVAMIQPVPEGVTPT